MRVLTPSACCATLCAITSCGLFLAISRVCGKWRDYMRTPEKPRENATSRASRGLMWALSTGMLPGEGGSSVCMKQNP